MKAASPYCGRGLLKIDDQIVDILTCLAYFLRPSFIAAPAKSGADGHAFLLEYLLQFAGLVHLANDVAAADKLTFDV